MAKPKAAPKKPAPKTVKKVRATPAVKVPARKPAKKPVAGLADRVTNLPTDAWLLARVPPKLAASERAASLLALGYPHMLATTDEPVREFANGMLFVNHYDTRVVPRAALPAMLRYALANTQEQKMASLAAKPKPLDLPKALDWVLRYKTGHHVWLLEAIAGSEVFAEAMVSALEEHSVKDWNGGKLERSGYTVVRALGFVLWRVSPAVREPLRARLQIILAKLNAAGKLWRGGEALDVILNGRAAVERSGSSYQGELHLGDMVHAGDDPQWVADQVIARLKTMRPADRASFSIQFAVIGGPKVAAALRANIACYKKDQRKTIEEQLALCA